MSTTSSRKAKGRRLQQLVARELVKAFPQLEEDDVQSRSMGCAGSDIILSPLARKIIGSYDIECKNQESLSIWDALKQSADRSKGAKFAPTSVVIFTRNRTPVYVAMDLDHWIKLLVGNKASVEENNNE